MPTEELGEGLEKLVEGAGKRSSLPASGVSWQGKPPKVGSEPVELGMASRTVGVVAAEGEGTAAALDGEVAEAVMGGEQTLQMRGGVRRHGSAGSHAQTYREWLTTQAAWRPRCKG